MHRESDCCFGTLLGVASQKKSGPPVDVEGLSLWRRRVLPCSRFEDLFVFC